MSEDIFADIQPDGSWWINNAGLLVGGRGAVSVDACATERRTLAYLDAIGTVTDRPVRTLVNTHHHGDHTHGNGPLAVRTTKRVLVESPSWPAGEAWERQAEALRLVFDSADATEGPPRSPSAGRRAGRAGDRQRPC